MKKMILRALRNNRGDTIVLVTLAFTLLMTFGAFTVDIGRVAIEKASLQNAVDAATIAAARFLPDTAAASNAANSYIMKNGYSTSNISISFANSNHVITVNGRKEIDYTFAKILGLQSKTVLPSAAAQEGSAAAAFNYALFSGSCTAKLTLNGSSDYIGGSTHTNASFSANGSSLTITDDCEAVLTITVNGSKTNIGNIMPGAPYIPMPDFSDTIKQEAQSAGQYYNKNMTYDGSNMNLNSSIYVNGDLTINGSSFTGKGCILATGNITFNGSNLKNSASDSVCFYSENGSITVNGSNAVLDGIVYAPNGNITLNGSSQTINGRVIGNTITINGSHLNIISNDSDILCLPQSEARLIQ